MAKDQEAGLASATGSQASASAGPPTPSSLLLRLPTEDLMDVSKHRPYGALAEQPDCC